MKPNTKYQVFPGIEIFFNEVDTHQVHAEDQSGGNHIEIMHCSEGRLESEHGDSFYYLTPGDFSICREAQNDFYYPVKHYLGMTLRIDIDNTPGCLSCFLDDVKICPAVLAEKFCGDKCCCVMRSKPCLEHIFAEMYSVPENIERGYYKIKVLELLLFLSGMDPTQEETRKCCCSKLQIGMAKNVCKYLSENMDRHITIKQLSEKFHISPTQLKRGFKEVYDTSIYSCIRGQKMQAAAQELRATDRTVLEIAGRYGYENGSKFAKAFRETMGKTPVEHRNHFGTKV